jgi:hypothetical protein
MMSGIITTFDVTVLDGIFMLVVCSNLTRLVPGSDNLMGSPIAIVGLFL